MVSCRFVPLKSGLDRAMVKSSVVLEAFICDAGGGRGTSTAAAENSGGERRQESLVDAVETAVTCQPMLVDLFLVYVRNESIK